MSTPKKASGPYIFAAEFYGKLLEEYEDLQQHPNSARHMANFVMTAYHLTEWTWELSHDRLRDAPTKPQDPRQSQRVRWDYFKRHFPDLQLVSGLANGTKHCVLTRDRSVDTGRRGGAFGTGFSAGFDIDSLQVRDDGQMVDFAQVAERVMGFWASVFDPTA